ncbi:lipopolysaccharide assembly protein LapA domain-containing protein [Geminocystis herdmanii]|uniref:lipopolysaccharide assembly protein LapA domain-containing protein n=1 Tax=Geminocystis herdmanii TaxID=669359 RepID=UPI0003495949|nr:LapA family protein [Geminocystis herdmanii]
MNRTKQIIISLIIGFWLILIAVFSIQNIQLVSLKFFLFESIQVSTGVLLTLCLAGGFFLGSLIPLFFSSSYYNKYSKNNKQNRVKKNKKLEFKREWEEEKDPLFDWE